MSTEGADPTQRKVELSSGGDSDGDPGATAPNDEAKVSNTTVREQKPSDGGAGARAAQTEAAKSGGLAKFLAETLVELRKISWPDRQQVIRETASVILLVCLITVAVLGFDWAVAKAVFEPLDHFARSVGGGIGSQH